MNRPILIPLLLLSLSSCTVVDLEKGRITTGGDSINFKMTHKGDSVQWDSNQHSVIYDASGRMIGQVGGAVASVVVSGGISSAIKGGSNTPALFAAIPQVTQHVVNRKTNRTTPRPVLVTPAGKVVQPNVP